MTVKTWTCLTVCSLTLASVPASAQPRELSCSELPGLTHLLARRHFAPPDSAGTLRTQAAERFIELMDPNESLLLSGDADKLQRALGSMLEKDRSCAPLEAVADAVIASARRDESIATTTLGRKYAIDRAASIVLNTDERPRPNTEKERASQVRNFVNFQIATLVSTGLEMARAKKQVLKRYALAIKRLEERRDELAALYAEAVAQALDPHSSFLSNRELEDFQIGMRLSLEGIGAALRTENGFVVIDYLVAGGQAEKSGRLEPKDRIIAVAQKDGESVSLIDVDLRDAVRLIRGKRGTPVTLTILREGGTEKSFDVTIIRDKIDLESQAAKLTLETRKIGGRDVKLGIIELPSFYGGDEGGRWSHEDVERLTTEAKAAGVRGLVIDVSRNGGGLLREAVEISGLFIRKGAVVAAKDTSGRAETFTDRDPRVVYDGPLVVYTSAVSASASEILAGALQDYGRAVVVGSETTFGKGTVQTINPLPDLGAIKLTTGMFFLPSGRTTQQRGVPSDVRVPSLLDAYDVGEASLPNSLPPKSMRNFESNEANGSSGWTRVQKKWLDELVRRSAKRIKKSADFRAVAGEIKEIEKRRKELRVADLFADTSNDEDPKRVEKLEAVTRNEVVDVLADLVQLHDS